MRSWNMSNGRAANCALFDPPPPCARSAHLVGCCLRRARSASRSKPSRAAQPARERSVDSVDESATGSANFFGPMQIETSSSSEDFAAVAGIIERVSGFVLTPQEIEHGVTSEPDGVLLV